MGLPSHEADARVGVSGRILAKSSLFATSAIVAVATMTSAASADPQAGVAATTASTAAQGSEHPGTAAGQLNFNIAPQPLKGALMAFGSQSGLQVTFDASVPDGLSSKGTTGMLTPAHALRQLLAGTGVAYRFTDAHTIMLARKSVLDKRNLEAAHADTTLETIDVSTSDRKSVV